MKETWVPMVSPWLHETDSPNHRIARFGFFVSGLEKLPDEEEVDEVSFRCCLSWGMTAGEVFQFEPEKKRPVDIPLCWLVDRDPYSVLLWSLYKWVVFHPLYTLTNQVFVSLLNCSGFRGSYLGVVPLKRGFNRGKWRFCLGFPSKNVRYFICSWFRVLRVILLMVQKSRTTWDCIWNPIKLEYSQCQLVRDFFHQQYHAIWCDLRWFLHGIKLQHGV